MLALRSSTTFFAPHLTDAAMNARINAYRILIALALAAAALWIFAEVVEEVFYERDIVLDRAILRGLRSTFDPAVPRGPHWFESAARDITALGSFTVITILTVTVVLFLLIVRQRSGAVLVLVSVFGGIAIGESAKAFFARVRPDVVPPLAEVSSASFPSGHAMLSAVAYLTLAALIARLVPRFAVKAYVVGVGVFVATIVGVSRVYLGVHYPTDVLAGWSLGAAWALLCWSAADWYEHRSTK
jgi:undecaprenyl-diphosphatase